MFIATSDAFEITVIQHRVTDPGTFDQIVDARDKGSVIPLHRLLGPEAVPIFTGV